jgi:hypothetical protein
VVPELRVGERDEPELTAELCAATGSEADTPLVWGLRHGGRAAAGGDDAGGVGGVELDEQPRQHRARAARLLRGLLQVAVQMVTSTRRAHRCRSTQAAPGRSMSGPAFR